MPAVAVIGGKRILIAAAADGWVYGMLARTGEKLWSYKLSKRGLNTSIVVEGNYAYVSHSEEKYTTTQMGAVLCIDASKTGDITEDGAVWRHDDLTVGYAAPALANGRLYVVNNAATMICFDAKTGKKFWEYDMGRVGKSSPTVTADANRQAMEAMFGGPAARSASENAVLGEAGRDNALPGIRSSVGDPQTNMVDKGATTRDILAAPEGDGQFGRAVAN